MRPRYIFFALTLSAVTLFFFCRKSENKLTGGKKPIDIAVSIGPQKYFVERIGGDLVHVNVIVKPGQNHEVYEPAPQQMAQISRSVLFFRIGVPFETNFIEKITSANRDLKVVDTRAGIRMRKIESFNHIKMITGGKDSGKENLSHDVKGHRHEGENDPHIWLNPLIVKIQAEIIFNELSMHDPGNRIVYEKNYKKFLSDLDNTDSEIKNMLSGIRYRRLVVFHPAFGYFTDRYGLIQIPIEFEGKEPGQKELAFIIDFMKKERIKVIFIQKQFSMKSPSAVAGAVEGRVVELDPLSDDYLNNIKKIAQLIKLNLE